jgi:hypothetical protein
LRKIILWWLSGTLPLRIRIVRLNDDWRTMNVLRRC